MPQHLLVAQFGLTHECFNFLWQNFHVAVAREEKYGTSEIEGNDVEGDDVEEDEFVEVGLDRIQQEQEQQ
eukprot:8459483-Ditylum_brightwellii.AAC.1